MKLKNDLKLFFINNNSSLKGYNEILIEECFSLTSCTFI